MSSYKANVIYKYKLESDCKTPKIITYQYKTCLLFYCKYIEPEDSQGYSPPIYLIEDRVIELLVYENLNDLQRNLYDYENIEYYDILSMKEVYISKNILNKPIDKKQFDMLKHTKFIIRLKRKSNDSLSLKLQDDLLQSNLHYPIINEINKEKTLKDYNTSTTTDTIVIDKNNNNEEFNSSNHSTSPIIIYSDSSDDSNIDNTE